MRTGPAGRSSDAQAPRSCNLAAKAPDVTHSREQPIDRDVFIERVPVDAPGAQLAGFALLRGRGEQVREPGQGYAEGASVVMPFGSEPNGTKICGRKKISIAYAGTISQETVEPRHHARHSRLPTVVQ